jgi:transketolase
MSPLDRLCINTIRMLSADAVQRARSGHPGMPMGTAAMAYLLWTSFLRHHPGNPEWPDRDRFLLSAGHGSMLLYSLLHLSGYDLSLDEIRNFRQWGSRTPGHPEHGLTPGVEVTTGPLGQGFANGVGMAMAERFLAARFNRSEHEIVDHFTYAIVSDGDLMEGLSHEAASLAGHLKLGKLIYLYDDNRITIEGPTALACSDDAGARFAAYGWHVQSVDGDDLETLAAALARARDERERPSLIVARTHIGHGSPNRQDTAKAHGEPLGEEEVRLTKEALGWPPEPAFLVPDEVRAHFAQSGARGKSLEGAWRERLAAYARAYPAEKVEWDRWMTGGLPEGWDRDLAALISETETQPQATRAVSGAALNALAPRLGNLVGGSADLGPSNNTVIRDAGYFVPGRVEGPNVHFGVREHAMAAASTGMALHGGLRPFCATFLVFSDYLRPAFRLAAISQAPVIYVFTHDSIGVGEDGPTHQPIEHLAALRAIPGLTLIRPADARETIEAWQVALQRRGPVALVLTRQKLPALPRERARMPAAAGTPPATPLVGRGGYVLSDAAPGRDPDLILIATGSEVFRCLEAQARLEASGIAARVVSLPSWELFDEQTDAYREFVLPVRVRARLAVEAACPLGWERYAGAMIGITRFGASAPEGVLFEKFGFTAAAIAERAVALLGRGVQLNSGT